MIVWKDPEEERKRREREAKERRERERRRYQARERKISERDRQIILREERRLERERRERARGRSGGDAALPKRRRAVPRGGATDDFFISYKWARHSDSAARVARHLESRGFRVWLDRHRFPVEKGTRISDRELKRVLADAAERAAVMVFFETYSEAQMAASPAGGDPVLVDALARNWQQFERQHARRLVFVYPDRRTLEYPASGRRSYFTGLRDLAGKIERHYVGGG